MASRALRIEYDALPPSDNHIRDIQYRFIQGKRRAVIGYTPEAENYKKGLIRHINDAYFFEVQLFARGHRPEALYMLQANLSFPLEDILTAGWLQETRSGEKKAKSPYKRLDVMNRRKLLEDALSEAIGIDDSLFWDGEAVKLVGREGVPAVTLMLEEVDPRIFGVPDAYLRGAHAR